MIKEIMTEKCIDSFAQEIKKIIDGIKTESEWKDLFVSTGESLTKNINNKSFKDDLCLMFSYENMSQLAKGIKNVSGYSFRKVLHDELYSLMVKYEIPADEAESYIHHFVQVIVQYISDNNSNKSMEVFLGEMKEDDEKNFEKILSQLDAIRKCIEGIKEDGLKIYSIKDLDYQIRYESNNKGMGIDFFELDDEQFRVKLKNNIGKECIFVVGKSREETTYRVLNELKDNYPDKVVLIIKTKEDWEKLHNNPVSGSILIPFFCTDQIVAIPNNTNIFVFGEDEPCYGKDKLYLQRRTRKNLIHSLEKIGMTYEDAFKLVEKTHGLYLPLKKVLFNGAVYDCPDWAYNPSDVVLSALLCGKFTDSVGDQLVLEELSGKKYDECVKELKKFIKRENPLLVKHSSHNTNSIQLASVEDAWEELDGFITDELWDKFLDLFFEVLIESEPIFDFPFEKHFEASFYAKKTEWSSELKRGMIRTLTMRAYYRGHDENQKQVDIIVKKLLDTVTTKERWGYISQYITDLCEASPESVLKKLESEIVNPQGMLDLFNSSDGNILIARNYYTNVLWAVEQLIQQKKYMVRAIKWLWKVDAYNYEYKISNSPKSVLEIVFCPWIQETPLTIDDKIRIAKKAIEEYENAWELIASNLPMGRNSICVSLSTPKYRKIDEPAELYVYDMNHTYIEYLKMCVEAAGINAERWIKIIEHLDRYDTSEIDSVFEKMVLSMDEMEDNAKETIKQALREKVFRHRYYAGAEWSVADEVIIKFEEAMNKIVFLEKEYDYIYIFSDKYSFPLLHPNTFELDDSCEIRHNNEQLRKNEIKKKIDEIKDNGYSIRRIIEIAIVSHASMLGEILAEYYCDSQFKKDIFNILLEEDESGECIYAYISFLYRRGVVNLEDVVNHINCTKQNDNLIVAIIRLQIIESEDAIISKQDDSIKRLYWKNNGISIVNNANEQLCSWVMNECKKYGTLEAYLDCLYSIKKNLTVEKLFAFFVEIAQMHSENNDTMTNFYLKEILKILQEAYLDDEMKCGDIASIEWLCREALEWKDMICLQNIIKSDPTFYTLLVRGVFKNDLGESFNSEEKNIANRLYSAYDKAKFCPAEKDGNVEYDRLIDWIELFRKQLIEQKQNSLFGNLLGRLLAYSPIGEDGYSPCEAVRRVIEDDKYYTDELKRSFIITEENKRGVHTVDAGKSEWLIHERYLKNAEALQTSYPRTADIYFALSDIYKRESESERKRAVDEW